MNINDESKPSKLPNNTNYDEDGYPFDSRPCVKCSRCRFMILDDEDEDDGEYCWGCDRIVSYC